MNRCCICGVDLPDSIEPQFFTGGSRPQVMCPECERNATKEYFGRREVVKDKRRRKGLDV